MAVNLKPALHKSKMDVPCYAATGIVQYRGPLQKVAEPEMCEDIYANVENKASQSLSSSQDSMASYEDINMNSYVSETGLTRRDEGTMTSGADNAMSQRYRLATVCLVVLCVLLLVAITVLCIKLTAEREQLQTRYNSLTTDRDQIQTKYKSLHKEKDQLQTRYNNLNTEKDQLHTRLKNVITGLNLDQDKIDWRYFSFSLYYISTEVKNWDEARKVCRGKNADLVSINSKEEQEFMHMLRGDKMAWIGLTDSMKEGDWKWVDGIALHTGYWLHGEPNSKAGDEDCVVTGYGSDKVLNWADYPCRDTFVWICEKRILEGFSVSL